MEESTRIKKPKWLRVKLPVGKKYTELREVVDKYKLNICLISILELTKLNTIFAPLKI